MKRLKNKLLLEVAEGEDELEDEDIDISNDIDDFDKEDISINDNEKTQFVVSYLSDLQDKCMDIFDSLTNYIYSDNIKEMCSEENLDLLNSIYEDISLIIGKVQQGIKNNADSTYQDKVAEGEEAADDMLSTTIEEK